MVTEHKQTLAEMQAEAGVEVKPSAGYELIEKVRLMFLEYMESPAYAEEKDKVAFIVCGSVVIKDDPQTSMHTAGVQILGGPEKQLSVMFENMVTEQPAVMEPMLHGLFMAKTQMIFPIHDQKNRINELRERHENMKGGNHGEGN